MNLCHDLTFSFLSFYFFFFNDTATTEIYTGWYTFPYTTLFRSTANRTRIRDIDNIEDQRHVHGNCRMQAARRQPRAIAHAADKLAVRPGRLHGQAPAVTRHGIALAD